MDTVDNKLTDFTADGKSMPVKFVETLTVKDGVECDVYTFVDDNSRDLAIVRVTKGYKTPLQKILFGTKTIEGFVNGEGTLTVSKQSGSKSINDYKPGRANDPMVIKVGEIMQWHANGASDLIFYEICEPPYKDGRFENLPEDFSDSALV